MHKFKMMVGPLMASALLVAAPAFAGVGGSVAPTYPTGPLHVGDTFPATLTITNSSNGANAGDRVSVSNIRHTPSCGEAEVACTLADPGVFDVSSGTGEAGTACAGVKFQVSPVNEASGEVQFEASSAWTLGPANKSAGPASCQIRFMVTVVKAPRHDSAASAQLAAQRHPTRVNTISTAQATFSSANSRAQGIAMGTSSTSFNATTASAGRGTRNQ